MCEASPARLLFYSLLVVHDVRAAVCMWVTGLRTVAFSLHRGLGVSLRSSMQDKRFSSATSPSCLFLRLGVSAEPTVSRNSHNPLLALEGFRMTVQSLQVWPPITSFVFVFEKKSQRSPGWP